MSTKRKLVMVCSVLLILAALAGGVLAAFRGSNAGSGDAVVGSSEEPVALGQQGRLGSWDVAIASPIGEATGPVLVELGLNQPLSGAKYYTVRLTAINREPKALWFAATYAFVGRNGNVFYPSGVASSGGTLLVTQTDGGEYLDDVPSALFFSTK